MDVVRAARHSQPTGAPFNLITHCAIRWADFDGVLWQPTEPLDRREELPAGWETPLQRGVFTVEPPHRTTFTSPAGTLTFARTESRPRARGARICRVACARRRTLLPRCGRVGWAEPPRVLRQQVGGRSAQSTTCLLYTSDAADDLLCVDLG